MKQSRGPPTQEHVMTRRLLPSLNRFIPGSGLRVAGPIAAGVALARAGTACSPVQPAGNDNNSGGGGQTTAGQDVFGDPAKADQVKQGGTLTVALSADPYKLDPTLAPSRYLRYVLHTRCKMLYVLRAIAK